MAAGAGAQKVSSCPLAFLALKARLELTDNQAQQLEAIAAKARENALAVLTPKQRETLKKLAAQAQARPRGNKGARPGCCPMTRQSAGGGDAAEAPPPRRRRGCCGW